VLHEHPAVAEAAVIGLKHPVFETPAYPVTVTRHA